jgi:hypothetical protein
MFAFGTVGAAKRSEEMETVSCDPRMHRRAALLTALLVIVCLVSAASDRRAQEDPTRKGSDLLLRSKDAYEQAMSHSTLLHRVRWLAVARTHLQDARHVALDASLERASGLHVATLSRKIEDAVRDGLAAPQPRRQDSIVKGIANDNNQGNASSATRSRAAARRASSGGRGGAGISDSRLAYRSLSRV